MDGFVHDVEMEVLKGMALMIGAGILWALRQGFTWANIKLSESRQASVERVLDKAMTFAVTELGDIITEKGWDHVDTRSAVINEAMTVVQRKFGDTLARAKVNLDDPIRRVGLMDQMQRMWPDLSSRLSASPATPDAPKVAAVVVPGGPQNTA